jgi:hypothetical protein
MSTDRLECFSEAVETKVALPNDALIRVELKGAVGTNIDTRLTKDTAMMIQHDDPIFVLSKRPLHWADLYAERVLTLDTALLQKI